MISAKRLIQRAKKRLTWNPAKEMEGSSGPSTSMASKDHCVMYSVDGRRFEVPLAYLCSTVFIELLRQSQEEIRFANDDGRITLPCDTTVIEYMMCLLRRDASEEIEMALLSSMVRPCHYRNNGCVQTMGISQQVAVSSF